MSADAESTRYAAAAAAASLDLLFAGNVRL
jgi:hypothetical protein